MEKQTLLKLRFLSSLKAIQETGLPFMVLKGPVYDITETQGRFFTFFTDLDIVPLAPLRVFTKELAAGERFIAEVDPRQENYYDLEQVPWIDSSNGMLLDVHAALFQPLLGKKGRSLDNALGEYAAEYNWNGLKLTTLNPAYMTFFLLLHGEKHFWKFEKDRTAFLQARERLSAGEEQLFTELVKTFQCQVILETAENIIEKQLVHRSWRTRYCTQHLFRLEARGYPAQMEQVWRPANTLYRFCAAPSIAVFWLRWLNFLLPVLPPAANTYKKAPGTLLRFIHLLRMLKLAGSYKADPRWLQLLKAFNYPLPRYQQGK